MDAEFFILFGNALEQQRRKLGLSQRAVAALAGIATRSYREVECGERQPRIAQLYTISNALEFQNFLDPLNTAYRAYMASRPKADR